jgi:hypothetical protein
MHLGLRGEGRLMVEKMGPRLAPGDPAHCRRVDAGGARHFGLSHSRAAETEHLEHLGLAELRGGAFFTATNSCASLAVHVAHIFSLRADEEMVGADAGRVVAAVADDHPGWDRPVDELPSDPVRALHNACHRERSILPTKAGLTARPQPATVGLLDLGPEAFLTHSDPREPAERGRGLRPRGRGDP